MIPCQKPKMVSFASSIKKKLLFVLLDLQPFYFQNILRLLGILPSFPFTPSETMSNYYL